jgi:hypothetical protein
MKNNRLSTRTFWRLILVAVIASVLLLAAQLTFPSVRSQEAVDITEIFWCENEEMAGELPEEQAQELAECQEARGLILLNCTTCHAFVPIIVQKTEEEWDATLTVHRPRSPELSDEEVAKIRNYLVTHFNPDTPLPELPEHLRDIGTDQAF